MCTTVDPVLGRRAADEAQRRGITRARLLREALVFYLADGSTIEARLGEHERRIARLESDR